MTPRNGATDVSPTLTEFRITFDRPMRDKVWDFAGDRSHFPKSDGGFHYDKECKVFTMPVRLKPNQEFARQVPKQGRRSFCGRAHHFTNAIAADVHASRSQVKEKWMIEHVLAVVSPYGSVHLVFDHR